MNIAKLRQEIIQEEEAKWHQSIEQKINDSVKSIEGQDYIHADLIPYISVLRDKNGKEEIIGIHKNHVQTKGYGFVIDDNDWVWDSGQLYYALRKKIVYSGHSLPKDQLKEVRRMLDNGINTYFMDDELIYEVEVM